MKRSIGSSLRKVRSQIGECLWNDPLSDEKMGQRYLFCCIAVFVAGFITAATGCFFVGLSLTERAGILKLRLAKTISERPISPTHSPIPDSYLSFSTSNPFGAVMPDDTRRGCGEKIRPLKDMSLAGTLPGIGAWIRESSSTRFVLKGKSIDGYRLEDIEYCRVFLLRDGETHTLYMEIASGNLTPPPMASAAAGIKKTPPPPPKSPPKSAHPGIEPAKEGVEGVIPRELVDKLLMDPYDELSKMRMVPAESGGMQLVRIAPDSVLGLVGVQKDDVIKAVNGVEITNLGDATNAVNSMMSGTRFDVKVERSGQALELRYQVK